MPQLSSEFLNYLAEYHSNHATANQASLAQEQLPTLYEVSKELGVSVSLLREQLEVAKAIGLVEVRPRTGMRRLAYSFFPAVWQSLSYAITLDWNNFLAFSDLRNHLEAAYWDEAARKLTSQDQELLLSLLQRAWEKLRGQPIQIPHSEHRLLHLTIFSRLDNVFVKGLLEAYWEAYEAVGLNVFADYEYLEQVWKYHQQMVESICQGNYLLGYQALVEHSDLLFNRPGPMLVENSMDK